MRAQRVEPFARDRAHDVDRHAEGDQFRGEQRPLDVLRQVALRQHDHRLGAALPGHDEVALEAARVEVVPERGDEEDDVDVRSDDLLVHLGPGHLPRELRPPRQDGVDEAGAERDPVADGGEVGAPARRGAKPRRDLRPQLAALGVDVVGAAVLHGDARGDEAGRRVRFELRFELVRPAQVVQVQGEYLRSSEGREPPRGGSSYEALAADAEEGTRQISHRTSSFRRTARPAKYAGAGATPQGRRRGSRRPPRSRPA